MFFIPDYNLYNENTLHVTCCGGFGLVSILSQKCFNVVERFTLQMSFALLQRL